MRFGCVFPTCEIGTDPVAVRDWAQTAEELGYSHIVTYDHVLGAVHADRDPKLWGPYDETHPFHEPMVLFGYLAGLTSRIEMMTGVLISPQRQGVLVAKQAAELAILSGNRFRLGVGTGWNHVEYDGLGMPFDERGRVLDEQIRVWRALWSGEIVEFEGEYHRIDRANCLPAPSQPVPVWLGGSAPAAIRRAATVGDGFVFGASGERARAAGIDLVERLEANGRRDGFGIDVLVGYGDGPTTWHDVVERWQPLGVDTVSVRTLSASSAMLGETDPGFTTAKQHIDALEAFMTEMGGAA